ncbi:hypothetical protein ACWGJW_35845 [Streptomyces nigrescens]
MDLAPLIAAVIGSVATVGVGYLAHVRSVKQQLKAKREELDLQLEKDRSQIQLEAERDAQAKAEKAKRRFNEFRQVGREWEEYLDRIMEILEDGAQVNLGEFDSECARLSKETRSAAAELSHDGVWIASDDDIPTSVSPEFISSMSRAAREIRKALLEASHGTPPCLSISLTALNEASALRADLRNRLVDHYFRSRGEQLERF